MAKSAPRSNILLPLYIYPHPGAWDGLEQSVATYPSVSFTVVINPFNGPGPKDLPDKNYQREIVKLTSHPNVRVVGYIHTTWGRRQLESLLQDIDRYAKWPKVSGQPGLKVTGFFFDETPNMYSDTMKVYLTRLRDHIHRLPGGQDNIIIHNPGCVPAVDFMKLADATVIFEDSYHTFRGRVASSVLSTKGLSSVDRNKLACVVHSIPSDLGAEEWCDLGQVARQIAGDLFMTDLSEHYYASFSPKWIDFVASMAT